MTTILVDLEGTLSDHTDRLRVLQATTKLNPKDRTAWKTYYQGLINDEPRENVMYAVREWIRKDIRPLVYSTRFVNKYNQEEEWLRGHELWEHVDLIQRLPQEPAIKGPDLVCQWVWKYKPMIIVDDREEVRDILKRQHPQVAVLGPEDLTRPAA
jgi:FMN phosphatase YigB (HAD superfamily)